MKTQTYRTIAAIFFALALASLACQAEYIQKATEAVLPTSTVTLTPPPPPTATVLNGQAILAPILTKMGEVQTMHIVMNLVQQGTENTALTGEGWSKGKDQYHFKTTSGGQTTEVLALSATEFYVKVSGSETWMAIPTEGIANIARAIPLSQISALDFALNPTLLGDETLEGVACYHISYDIDMTKYLNAFSSETVAQIDLTAAVGKSEIWVGKEDGRIYKWIIGLNYTEAGVANNIQYSLVFNEFNSPVFLPDPTP